MASMVSPDNAPRTLEGLSELSRAVRYRLALNMGIVDSDPSADNTKAFLGSAPQVQCEALLSALSVRDGGMGQQQAPAQQPAPGGMQPMGHVNPTPMAPTGMQPMSSQQHPAPKAQRTPATPGDPTNAGAQASGASLGSSPELMNKLNKVLEELDSMPGLTEIEELKELLLGSVRIQRTMLMLCFEIAENAMGMDKATILGMISITSKSGEIEAILAKTNEGKA